MKNLNRAIIALAQNTKRAIDLAGESLKPTLTLSGDRKLILNGLEQQVEIPPADSALFPEEFGAVGDGVSDDTSSFLRAIEVARAAKKTIKATGIYKIDGEINLRSVAFDFSAADINLGSNGQIIIGGNAGTSWNPNQSLGRVVRGNVRLNPADYSSAKPSVRCVGAKGQSIYVKYVDFIQFWQSTDPATFPADASQAYNRFNIDFAVKIEIDTDERFNNGTQADGAGSANQWFNENKLNLNRCYAFEMKGSYRHNHNIITGGSFETRNSYIDIQSGNKNHFRDLRLEGIGAIKFGINTEGNTLQRGWYGSVGNLELNLVEDKGLLNRVETFFFRESEKTRVFEISQFTPKWNNRIPSKFSGQVGRVIRPTIAYGVISESDIFSFRGQEDVLIFNSDVVDSKYVVRVYIYKSDGSRAKPSEIEMSSNFLTKSDDIEGKVEGTNRGGYPYGQHRFLILSEGDFYLKIQLLGTSKPDESKSRFFEVDLYSRYPRLIRNSFKPYTISAPTQYIGFQGDYITHKKGVSFVEFYQQTSVLSVAAGESVASLRIDNTAFASTSLKLGDAIGFESIATGKVHWTTVKTEESGVLSVEEFPDWVAVGDYVYISRLVTVQSDVDEDVAVSSESIIYLGKQEDAARVFSADVLVAKGVGVHKYYVHATFVNFANEQNSDDFVFIEAVVPLDKRKERMFMRATSIKSGRQYLRGCTAEGVWTTWKFIQHEGLPVSAGA